MIKQVLLEKFNKDTSGKNDLGGKRILENDLISNFNVKYDDDLVYIDSKIISENYFNEYNSKMEIDINTKNIISTFCSCDDFERNELRKHNYCCKHLFASFYKFLNELDNNEEVKAKFNETLLNKIIFKSKKENILDLLLEEENKNEIKIEVYINKQGLKNKLAAEFKIGLKGLSSNRLYVIKDINQLLTSYYNRIPIKYGKDFNFDLRYQRLGIKEKKIIDFIEKVKDIESASSNFMRRQDKYIDGKMLIIPDFLIREFFDTVSKNRVYLNEGFFYKPVESEIIFDKPSIKISLKGLEKEYLLSLEDGIPEKVDKKGTVFIYGSSIYLPSLEYCYDISTYLNIFNNTRSVSIDKGEEIRVLSKLLPKLYTLSNDVSINKSIKNKIVKEDVKFKFYFDKVNRDVTLTLKVKYGEHEFNIFHEYKNKIIYRDLNKEREVMSFLRSLGFDASGDKFYLLFGDDFLFKFFKYDIEKLQDVGEVFYSQNFKMIKQVNSKNIKGNIQI